VGKVVVLYGECTLKLFREARTPSTRKLLLAPATSVTEGVNFANHMPELLEGKLLANSSHKKRINTGLNNLRSRSARPATWPSDHLLDPRLGGP
jgi:hypothetical protein